MEHFLNLGSEEHRLDINPDHISAFRIERGEATLYLLSGEVMALTAEESKRFIEIVDKTKVKRKIGLGPS
jgi:hypothetical protein